jgi:hypothetical protein
MKPSPMQYGDGRHEIAKKPQQSYDSIMIQAFNGRYSLRVLSIRAHPNRSWD